MSEWAAERRFPGGQWLEGTWHVPGAGTPEKCGGRAAGRIPGAGRRCDVAGTGRRPLRAGRERG